MAYEKIDTEHTASHFFKLYLVDAVTLIGTLQNSGLEVVESRPETAAELLELTGHEPNVKKDIWDPKDGRSTVEQFTRNRRYHTYLLDGEPVAHLSTINAPDSNPTLYGTQRLFVPSQNLTVQVDRVIETGEPFAVMVNKGDQRIYIGQATVRMTNDLDPEAFRRTSLNDAILMFRGQTYQ